MCGELLVARRCKDRVWHWAHKPHTNQKQGTCLFDDSPWALTWRLGYLMFPGWQIELPKKAVDRTHLIHAINPTTKQVREFVGHINEANEPRFQFLLAAQNHNVCWMFSNDWVRACAKSVGQKGGLKDMLKPKAAALYERIVAAGQNALVHTHGENGGSLYKEWTKKPQPGEVKGERTGLWFPLTGDAALAVLDNFSRVTLPYDNARSEAELAEKTEKVQSAKFSKLINAI